MLSRPSRNHHPKVLSARPPRIMDFKTRVPHEEIAMSIFRKDCPQCAATLPVAAEECGCGYAFEPDEKRESQPSLAEIAKQEGLYEEYLRVRAEHALQAARVAADVAALDPTDNRKAVQATLGRRAAESAQAELAAQAARASQFNQLARSRAHGWQTPPAGAERVGKR